jgi:hypothetical protein
MSTNDARNSDALSCCCQGGRLPVTSLPTQRKTFRVAAPPRTSYVVLTLMFIGLSGLEYLYHNEFMQQQQRHHTNQEEAQTTCRCHNGSRSGALTANTHRLGIDDDAAVEVAVLCLFGKFPGPDVQRTLVMASAMAVAHDYTVVQSATNTTVNMTTL